MLPVIFSATEHIHSATSRHKTTHPLGWCHPIRSTWTRNSAQI